MTTEFTADEVRNQACWEMHSSGNDLTRSMLTAYADTLSKPADSGRVGNAVIERAAKAMYELDARDISWRAASPEDKAEWANMARAALLAAPPIDVQAVREAVTEEDVAYALSVYRHKGWPAVGSSPSLAMRAALESFASRHARQVPDDYKEIARLIGSIFFCGNFKAETHNERRLEKLLRKTGNFYDTEAQWLAAAPSAPEGGEVDRGE